VPDDPLDDEQAMIDAETEQEAASIAQRAANGESDEETVAEVKLGGDVQLSLDVGKVLDKGARKISEATVSLSAAEVPADGLFKPDQRYPFVAMGVPGNITTHYVRDAKSTAIPKRVVGVKLRQTISVDTVRRADDPEVIRELFALLLEQDAESAGALLDSMREDAGAKLSLAA
jgi:hypothetical protein